MEQNADHRQTSSDQRALAWYRAAVRSAWIAGAFLAVVCLLLLLDCGSRLAKDPHDTEVFTQLQAQWVQRPDDEALRQAIRTEDRLLREAWFRQRRFARMGAWLLLAGAVVLMVSFKAATTIRRKLPAPGVYPSRQDSETRIMRIARWSVAGLAAILIGTVVTLSATLRSELAGVEMTPSARSSPAQPAGRAGPPAAVALDLPTPEEIARNWPRFRGPGGRGISPHHDIPTAWDAKTGKGILWKTALPLPGNNSPVVWEKKVFLSGADEKHRQVYCLDADSGKLLWQTEVPGNVLSTAKPPKVSDDAGLAAPSVATDGRRVFAVFANGDLGAIDFDGKLVWNKSLGIPKNIYGHASSLAVWRDRLIMQFDQGGPKDGLSKLLAFHVNDGAVVWSTPRPVANSWPTPIVIEHEGSPQIITCADPWVIAYKPEDGSEIWRAKCLRQDVGPSPTYAGGRVIAVNEYPQMTAIDPGGHGDVTKTHILWTAEDNLPDLTSPLATEKYVYVLASYGYLTCYDMATGEMLWEWESDANFSSSPSLAEGRIYLFGTEGEGYVIEPGEKAGKTIAQCSLGEECVTSPAFQDGRIYIRGKQHVFCLGGP